MRVLCIGCSWTDKWPDYLKLVSPIKRSFHGGGLSLIEKTIKNYQNNVEIEAVVCQLPTPIRTFSRGDTEQSHQNFVHSFQQNKQDSIEKLLTEYKDLLLDINNLHSNVIFFLYNTGGYPLRHPFDFGEDIDNQFVKFFQDNNMKHIHLSFEGKSGYCKKEEDCDDLDYKNYAEKNMRRGLTGRSNLSKKYWVWQHPKNRIIYDAHPNENADKVAAKVVEEYINQQL